MQEYRVSIVASVFVSIQAKTQQEAFAKAREFVNEHVDGVDLEVLESDDAPAFDVRLYMDENQKDKDLFGVEDISDVLSPRGDAAAR